jgi:hypothetical protein
MCSLPPTGTLTAALPQPGCLLTLLGLDATPSSDAARDHPQHRGEDGRPIGNEGMNAQDTGRNAPGPSKPAGRYGVCRTG